MMNDENGEEMAFFHTHYSCLIIHHFFLWVTRYQKRDKINGFI